MSFEAPAGHTIAIVGPSGAGKSTISRLLFRFYEPSSGRITVDGQDIRAVTQASLRASVGMVPQDTVLFNDTILYNIRYGRDGASDEEVHVRRRKCAHRCVHSHPAAGICVASRRAWPETLGRRETAGGDRSHDAQGRRRYSSSTEATSALDSFTEREIQDALERVSEGRTTLIIAHRLSTVVHANEILVLDKGVIAERGKHDELLEKGGIYAALWNRQREVDAAQEALRRAGVLEEKEEEEQEEAVDAAGVTLMTICAKRPPTNVRRAGCP